MNNSSSTTKAQRKAKTLRNRERRKRQKARKNAPSAQLRNLSNTRTPVLSVAPCTRAYMKALVDPFRVKVQPCIPDTIILPSFKYSTKVTGTMSTGANGFGFVLFDPWKAASSPSAPAGIYQGAPVLATTADYAALSIQRNNPTVGLAPVNSNASFTYSFLTEQDKQIRLVAAGIKLSYIGSDFRNQGQVVLYRTQTNQSVPNGTTVGDMFRSSYTIVKPVSRREEYIYYTPDSTGYLSYQNYASYFALDPTGTDHYAYCIAVSGGDLSVPQSWAFEACCHYELIGSNIPLTKSDGDAVGFNHALSVLDTRAPTDPPMVEAKKLWNRFVDGFMESATQVVYTAGSNAIPLAMAGASAYVSRGRGLSTPTITDY